MNNVFTLAIAMFAVGVADPPASGEKTSAVHRSGTITQDDYPAAALRDGAEGIVAIRLDVSEEGRVSGCTILSSSGHSALDGSTCGLAVRRFRFNPARDAAGNPRPGRVTQTIRWTRPAPPEPGAAQGDKPL